ncbi:uncharacterized protein LOC122300257 [Carya illinoinensis]|uniref:uncharacterized protein LOC122300257 n=1 Tax=Carya illinoinensis TaxID=32201 RepID=UPI001C723D9C|nr:uncharacterized protein LOC122300257 [Carya illinoinensis]
MEEVLSRLLNKRLSEGRILPFSHPVNALRITHFLYADDVVVFVNGSTSSIRCLMRVLKDMSAGQGRGPVNFDKSVIFFSKHLTYRRTRELLMDTGFSEGQFSFTYLGAPIVDGRLKIRHFMLLLERVEKKLTGWKSRLLSQGCRLILLRRVFSSLPIHLLCDSDA